MATFLFFSWQKGHFLILFMADGHIIICLWQMATLSFVYGKWPLLLKWQMATLLLVYGKWPLSKMADGHIVVFKMADSQVLWPMATKRYVKFIYYANITYSSEERSWVLEI